VSTTLEPSATIVCVDPHRRADILAHPSLNGVDFIEYDRRSGPPQQYVVVVHFIKPLPDPPNSGPDKAYGLTTQPSLVSVEGGARVVGITVVDVNRVGDTLEISLSAEGDYSIYTLRLGWTRDAAGHWIAAVANLDPATTVVSINFKAGCPVDVDCRDAAVCAPEQIVEPRIDYLAKDYASFRRLLIDLIPQLNPGWLERTPADLGIALVELLAYEGDQLSYFQDAVANEMFLETARQRVSAKRHARLVDYAMHDGRNAWTFVHVRARSAGVIPYGTVVLTRIVSPLAGQSNPPGLQLAAPTASAFETDPALARTRAFETTFDLTTHIENNEIHIHTWGDQECCLPALTTEVYLFTLSPPVGATQTASAPPLAIGDFVLFEEVMGPLTGAPADANPAHRRVVRITNAQPTIDPVYADTLLSGKLRVLQPGDNPLPLLRIEWTPADGDAFPMCLSSRPPGLPPLLDVTIARGNMVAVDHGLTVDEQVPLVDPVDTRQLPFLLRLAHGPMTMQAGTENDYLTTNAPFVTAARTSLAGAPGVMTPAVRLLVDFPVVSGQAWTAAPTLLDSRPFDANFVVDVGDDGVAVLRFGDGEYGREIDRATAIRALYRVGNGRAGNVGAESIFHIARPSPLLAPAWPAIEAIRNPRPSRDGTEPETIEDVRQYAPAAFRAKQFRAVTEQDYVDALKGMPRVAASVASFRWTGSWYTVYIGIDPIDPADLITLGGGRTQLTPDLANAVRGFLSRYTLAGYDLEIRTAEYVPLDIAIDVCVCSSHFRAHVVQAVKLALSNRVNPDGSMGFFDPARFTFNEDVHLSRLYTAVEKVPGVDSLTVTRFQRYGALPNRELETGVIPIAAWEIARLDNDPNFLERGVLEISGFGGK
jgi:hypothetical protein